MSRCLHGCLAALAAAMVCTAHADAYYAGAALTAPNFISPIGGTGGDGGGHGPGFKLFGGYGLTRGFGVELGYFDLGRSQDRMGRAKGHGVYLDGIGSLPVSNDWSLIGSLGIAQGRLYSLADSESGTALKLGVGAQYQISGSLSLRLGYDWYRFGGVLGGKPEVGQAALSLSNRF